MTTTQGERIFNASMDEFEAMQAYVTAAALAAGFDRSAVNKIQLASEEALVNVINYAYDGGPGTLTVAWSVLAEGGLHLQITDSGRAFDPLARPDPDITVPLEERPIGGLGIFMVKQIMDEVSYERAADRNVLTMVKRRPTVSP